MDEFITKLRLREREREREGEREREIVSLKSRSIVSLCLPVWNVDVHSSHKVRY
jgi:hypothetical protein